MKKLSLVRYEDLCSCVAVITNAKTRSVIEALIRNCPLDRMVDVGCPKCKGTGINSAILRRVKTC